MVNPKVQSFSFMGARHKTNDDAILANPEQGIYVLCDGVSEGGEGKFAADFISRSIQEKLTDANTEIKKTGSQLSSAKKLLAMQEQMIGAFTSAQINLQKTTTQNPKYKLSSTTCIALWLDGRFAIMAHIGDSRAYLFRAGKLYQLTKDHSGLDELIAMGLPYDVAVKNPLSRSLTRAFGNARYTHPDLLKIEFQPNDMLMMCTDGVYTSFVQNNLQALVQAMQDPKQNIKEWIERCSHQSGDDSSLLQIHFPTSIGQDSPIQASDRIKLIQQTPLCKYFDYIQRSHLAAICEIEQFKAGSLIIQEGTDGESMYILAKGTLGVSIKGQHLSYMKPGEFFGEVALIHQIKRTATVVAQEDSLLLCLKRQDLNEVFKKNLLIEKHFYKAMLEVTLERWVSVGDELARIKGL